MIVELEFRDLEFEFRVRCLVSKWIGFNLEYGDLENGSLEAILISKIKAMGISKKSDGYLEFSLENGNLEK